jgi:hypothetical protein
MSDRDYYEILGLTPAADRGMVDQAYWHLARKYQQMATSDGRAPHLLDELNEAYAVIGTPRLREQYDAFRDDVLVTRGMIRPLRAKPRKGDENGATATEPWSFQAPPNSYTYATSAIIVLLALAAAWQGVHLVLVIPVMVAGLMLSLLPALKRRLAGVDISVPAISIKEVSLPQVSLPSITGMPDMRAVAASGEPAGEDDELPELGVGELRASTAAMIGRWRQSIGLKGMQAEGFTAQPRDATLVEAFEPERDLETEGAPLDAAMDILRGAGRRG